MSTPFPCIAAVLLSVLAAVSPLRSQEEQGKEEPPEPQAARGPGTGRAEVDRNGDPQEEEAADPCSPDVDAASWLDRTQSGVASTVCRAARWFDGLFGDERIYVERNATFGRVKPTLDWNEIDGVEPGLEFRAKVNLPRLDRRLNALFGRDEPEDLVEDSADQDALLPDAFRDTDEEWLIGLGYTPLRSERRRLDFGAGFEVRAPPELFVQGRYRHLWLLSDRNLLRLRETPFWRSDDGIGSSTRLDFERALGGPLLLRWRTVGTVAQRIEGLEWFEEIALFHRLGAKHALAYVVAAAGETDAEVPVRHYGVHVVYRRQVLREWLFLELRPGFSWRREEARESREATPVLGLGIEIQFGDHPSLRE